MPRRSILTTIEKEKILALPITQDEFIRLYAFSAEDLALIRTKRGEENRLGMAVHLCLFRFPGQGLLAGTIVPASLLDWIGGQIHVDPRCWPNYSERETTRREHWIQAYTYLKLNPFSSVHRQEILQEITELALQTDKGLTLAAQTIEKLRSRNVILPNIDVIERICAEATTLANRQVFAVLTDSLLDIHRTRLDQLLELRENGQIAQLTWLRQSPVKPNSRYMLEHIERLKTIQAIDLPIGIGRSVHRNRLLKIAREGGQMTPANLSKFEPRRRYATLVAITIESMATIIDEIIDLHDRIMGRLWNLAKNKQKQRIQDSAKTIREQMQLYGRIGDALLDARKSGANPFTAIESIISWDSFETSVEQAQKLAESKNYDFIWYIRKNYATLRRYEKEFLEVLHFKAAPAATGLLRAIDILREMNASKLRKLPEEVPIQFVRKRWVKFVLTETGIDQRFYEICVLSELKNALRSGDIWVQGSRQYKDFDDYLISASTFITQKARNDLFLKIDSNCDRFLENRLSELELQLNSANRMALANQLPDATIHPNSGLKIVPLAAITPDDAQLLIKQTAAVLPRVKITDLLLEVDEWTNFTRHFTHLKSGEEAKEKKILLTAILSDAINMGLTKMAEACSGTSYSKLSWIQAWYIRDDTYSAALAELTNLQLQHPFSARWGDGTTSSSDGQRFKVGSQAESTGHINPKYGSTPGRLIYTHISDQYAPFHTKLINVGVRDSTYVLDGLLYHESDIRIEEHYTDTAGFTDHVFALMNLLGFYFAPRIRDLKDTKLYIPQKGNHYESLNPIIGGSIDINQIRTHWDEILRLASSIKQGTVTASLMLRKLGSYPRQNGLALALRELGRIERTLFILDWLQNVELRRRVQAGLNKGEARNALARAVFFNRLGEIRDKNYDQQHYRASGLNLVTAAIVLWNTVYLERAIKTLSQHKDIDENLLQYLSPLGWEHISLTGDYSWASRIKLKPGQYRSLRTL